MSTTVRVNTYSYSITYLTDRLLQSLKWVISGIGLSLDKFLDDWSSTEKAINAWLRSGHLETIHLEIYDPKAPSTLISRWDFAVDYGYSASDDATMWVDTDAIKASIIKCGHIPSACSYRVLISNKPGRPDVEGWGPSSFLATDGFVKQSVGTAIKAGGLAAEAGYWRKR